MYPMDYAKGSLIIKEGDVGSIVYVMEGRTINPLFYRCPFFFSTRPSLGLLPVLGPLGSGTEATHQPSPALRLLGYIAKNIYVTMPQAGFKPTEVGVTGFQLNAKRTLYLQAIGHLYPVILNLVILASLRRISEKSCSFQFCKFVWQKSQTNFGKK